ncbi:MAG: zinc ABC transporter substrate-binding protein [Pseudorhodoplanes sp.]|nr:zinc ABC transporter substrate-binding protein [Pseudorhodoplanes sp.]
MPRTSFSIKPLHSLVAGVMGDVGTPHLIVAGGDEPHTYALRPSDAEALSKADVVFWIGENFETFLRAPLASLGAGRLNVEMVETPGHHALRIRLRRGRWAPRGRATARTPMTMTTTITRMPTPAGTIMTMTTTPRA